MRTGRNAWIALLIAPLILNAICSLIRKLFDLLTKAISADGEQDDGKAAESE